MLGRVAIVALCALSAASCGKDRLTRILPAGARVDVFPQVDRAQLDAVFVVDNSRFMGVHQARVADSFGRFLGWLERNQIDYHLALLSADTTASPGAYQGGGDKHYFVAQDAAGFPAAVRALGGTGNAISPALQQMDLALRGPPAGFLRPAAALFLVVVTDNNDPWSPGDDLYYARTFKQAKGAGNDAIVTLTALAGPVPDGCSIPDPQNPGQGFVAEAAPRLAGIVQRTGGAFASLCTPDFDALFDQLGASASGLKRSFRLGRSPDPASLQVTVRARCDTRRELLARCQPLSDECGESNPALACTPPKGGADGWSYDAATNSVTFAGASLPPRGAVVEVVYAERTP